jgi:hypothetical protein
MFAKMVNAQLRHPHTFHNLSPFMLIHAQQWINKLVQLLLVILVCLKKIAESYIVSISGFGLKENHSSMTYSVSVISLKEMDKGGYAAGRERDYQLLQP